MLYLLQINIFLISLEYYNVTYAREKGEEEQQQKPRQQKQQQQAAGRKRRTQR